MNFINRTFNWYFRREDLPYWTVAIFDLFLSFISAVIVLFINNHASALLSMHEAVITSVAAILIADAICFRIFHTYACTLRYSSFEDLKRLILAACTSFVILIVATVIFKQTSFTDQFFHIRMSSCISIYLLSLVLRCTARVWVKTMFENLFANKDAVNAFVYGTQSGAIGIAKNVQSSKPARFKLKGFLTEDPALSKSLLLGRHIFVINDELPTLMKDMGIKAVLISPLRINDFRNNEDFQNMFIKNHIKIYAINEAQEWNDNDGENGASQLKEVSIEDLLPRNEIQVDMESVGNMLRDKKILVTGSAGSIGSEMVRQIACYHPEQLILIDQAETPQHDIRLMMENDYPCIKAETIVTSICRKDRMTEIFNTYKPDYVFHAAAYKHVPMMENNPSESVLNNIEGTKIIADLSVTYGVKKFVMVSTDKAVNPTNVMGCSKRICEIYVQSLNKAIMDGTIQGCTQFITTRFGNVLGSNGSVIPLFRKQIQQGGPLTVTHPDIIRFFMLISEACKLVLEAGTKGKGGEIFVFDMGKPVKIAALAQRMIDLSGAKNVTIKYTGLRAGEKLYEEVLNEQETTKPSFHEKIRIATVRLYDYNEVTLEIDKLINICHLYNDMDTVRQMKAIVPEYKSKNSIYEELDQ